MSTFFNKIFLNISYFYVKYEYNKIKMYFIKNNTIKIIYLNN